MNSLWAESREKKDIQCNNLCLAAVGPPYSQRYGLGYIDLRIASSTSRLLEVSPTDLQYVLLSILFIKPQIIFTLLQLALHTVQWATSSVFWLLTWVIDIHCPVCPGCQGVWSQRKAVRLWPRLWDPTPPIWENWTWATIIQGTQEWSCCWLESRIQTVDWRLSGMNS